MSNTQQVVFRYKVEISGETEIPWWPQSKVVRVDFLNNNPSQVHFWVSMPVGKFPFSRTFYIVKTGRPFPIEDVAEGTAIWREDPEITSWQLIRREPGHTYN